MNAMDIPMGIHNTAHYAGKDWKITRRGRFCVGKLRVQRSCGLLQALFSPLFEALSTLVQLFCSDEEGCSRARKTRAAPTARHNDSLHFEASSAGPKGDWGASGSGGLGGGVGLLCRGASPGRRHVCQSLPCTL